MRTFLGFLPLTDGVNLLVAVNLTIVLAFSLVNSTEISIMCLLPSILCVFSSLFITCTWILVFYGNYKESSSLIRLALNMWIFYTILWFISVICAMTDDFESYVCIWKRGPESLWLFVNNWHLSMCLTSTKLSFTDNEKSLSPTYFEPLIRHINTTQRMKRDVVFVDSNHDFDYVILCSVIVLTNFIFGIFSLSNLLKQLKENYCQEPPNLTCNRPIMNTPFASQDKRPNIKVLISKRDFCKERK